MTSSPSRLHRAIVSVGSNIEPAKHVALARQILADETHLLAAADIIETAPVGYQHQPDFLNTAYLIETELERDIFNAYLKSVEDRLGRVRGEIKSGPRTIDLDLVVWDGGLLTEDYYRYQYVSIPVDQVASAWNIEIYSPIDNI
ncbi:2-amino-4-hydroxy-6-hydroxymethyldihydropteridine diphosphokinase [Porticoccus sp.]